MSNGLRSPDPVERLDAVRRIVRKLAAEHDVDEAHLARALGYAERRFHKVMTLGERSGLRLSDLVLLSEMLGEDDELLEALARARGFRLVRDAEAMSGPTALDPLMAACAANEETAAIVTRVAELRTAPTPSNRAGLSDALGRVRRQLARVEAETSQPDMGVRSIR